LGPTPTPKKYLNLEINYKIIIKIIFLIRINHNNNIIIK